MSDKDDIEGFLDNSKRGWSLPMLEQAARSIAIAHGIKPTSWCIHSWKDEPFVAVGAINIMSLGPSKPFGLLISVDSQFSLDLDAMAGVTRTARTFADRPWATYVHLDESHLAESLNILRKSHEDAVRRQANTVKDRTLRWKWHRDDFWVGVQEELGISLPKPGYAEELRLLSRNTQLEQIGDTPLTVANRATTSSSSSWFSIPDHGEGRRYWKIDCGRQGHYWPLMRDHEIAALENWSPETIHLDELPGDHHSFIAAITAYPGIATRNANHAWKFMHEISPGDAIVAIVGQRVYGWGLVTGDYTYADDDLFAETENSLPHRKPMEWYPLTFPSNIPSPSQALARQLWGIGPRELTYDGFVELLGGPPIPDDQLAPDTTSVAETIRSNFAAGGLQYTDTQISAFYTALQTKGFVVLSGISGTGKSKIATGFVEMLPAHAMPPWPDRNTQDDSMIPIKVSRTTKNSALVNFPVERLEEFPAPAPDEQWRIPVKFHGISHDCLLNHITHGGKLYRLYFSGPLRKRIVELPLDTVLYFRVLVDDESLTISGFEILLEEDLPEHKEDESQRLRPDPRSNHLFLSVRPDWRDSTSLLGYYNPLTQTYEWTDFLKFIIEAAENYKGPPEDRIAWFVILDEMNLAHVEYYFADLLSVIESGRDAEGWTAEPLRLTYPDTLDDEAPPRELRLPPNLYIIGTVNMDETTHAFSPKVLDRAFTIELTDVDFRDYPPSGEALGGAGLDEATKASLLKSFSRDGAFARIDKGEIAEFVERHPVVRERLQALNDVLRPFRMHFGYRVFDEIAQYLANNDANGMATFEEAFDQAVFMKVLPKFSGSRARLLSPLQGVLGWSIDPSGSVSGLVLGNDPSHSAWNLVPAFPRVTERVRDMIVALERDGFVSFG